ncbi:MAG: hypothetical protein ACE5DI_03005 [Candidatus Micrarchaeia archaeon]
MDFKKKLGLFFAAFFAFLLVASIVFAPFGLIVHAVFKVLTEGNSFGKQFIFLFFISAFFFFRSFAVKKRLPTSLKNAGSILFFLVVLGFALNVASFFVFTGEYGGSPLSYFARVVPCGEAFCWEGSYLQHNHFPKSSIFFAEQLFGVENVWNVDDGLAFYGLLPFQDVFAVVFIAIIGLVFLFGLIATLREDNVFFALAIASGSIVGAMSILDGGPFTVSGANALALLSVGLLKDVKPLSKTFEVVKTFAPLWVAALAIYLPVYLFGSSLVFWNWWTVPALAASLGFPFLLFDAFKKKGLKTLALGLSLLVVFLWGAQGFWQGFNFNYNGLAFEENDLVLSYGLPVSVGVASVDGVVEKSGASVLESAKYGWYYVANANFNKGLFSNSVQNALRDDFAFEGYLFAEKSWSGSEETFLRVHLVSEKEFVLSNFSTFSFKPASEGQLNGVFYAVGLSRLPGPHLALEAASFARFVLNKDVLVETKMQQTAKVSR